ncbi:hypothetical protein ACRE_086390 [Hapsidospora chrysogenum ATCC 11550]|uniref:Uncharacterized protein n=1 Tax=Hapsidospora chrysogenum (strain ATCC 11550 / CBS 779.69 / DSM 880 / IAM 14645 / JCM 23072 / IMI 49137) TaxID=857340 RepID=A0A086SU72_HAPC1|nr:hypothetical protein ACRE_086390 [Hapsidospora chrysogenum ATCC 11550]
MKFSLFSVVALLGVTAAAASSNGGAPRGFDVKVKRQRPDVNVPTMTDINGNVVPYNRDGVVQVQKLKAKRAAAAKAK